MRYSIRINFNKYNEISHKIIEKLEKTEARKALPLLCYSFSKNRQGSAYSAWRLKLFLE